MEVKVEEKIRRKEDKENAKMLPRDVVLLLMSTRSYCTKKFTSGKPYA